MREWSRGSAELVCCFFFLLYCLDDAVFGALLVQGLHLLSHILHLLLVWGCHLLTGTVLQGSACTGTFSFIHLAKEWEKENGGVAQRTRLFLLPIPFLPLVHSSLLPILFLTLLHTLSFLPQKPSHITFLPSASFVYPWNTLIIKKNKIFLVYEEIQMGAVAKSYMRKGFLIYEEMRKYLVINEEAVSHIWLCNRSLLDLEENFVFFFISE
jgi:hypothetical protein